jgi:hypothetical protein
MQTSRSGGLTLEFAMAVHLEATDGKQGLLMPHAANNLPLAKSNTKTNIMEVIPS